MDDIRPTGGASSAAASASALPSFSECAVNSQDNQDHQGDTGGLSDSGHVGSTYLTSHSFDLPIRTRIPPAAAPATATATSNDRPVTASETATTAFPPFSTLTLEEFVKLSLDNSQAEDCDKKEKEKEKEIAPFFDEEFHEAFEEVFNETLSKLLDEELSDQDPDSDHSVEQPWDHNYPIPDDFDPFAPGPSSKPVKPKETWQERRKKRNEKGRLAGMAEPRARAARQKGQLNFPIEMRAFLTGHGDRDAHPYCPQGPLPETVRVLDEIVTDYILEMCHEAAAVANYARRQKVKVEDFRFALRRDPHKLGRVQQLLQMDRELKDARKIFDQDDDQVASGKKLAEELDVSVDGTVETAKKSKGKGKRVARRDSDVTEDGAPKKRKVDS